MNGMNEKVLVTGAAGYIGSVLVRRLLEKGYSVRGFDNLTFGGESLIGVYNLPNFEFQKGDVRNCSDLSAALDGVQMVVHLAAIVGDPACSQQPELASEINWEASKKLFDQCRAKIDVNRFVFASTCSNYGKMPGNGYLNEDSPLRPVSLYAELKVKFENYMLGSKTRENFAPTALRFATVYGISPRLRFDLTVNEFTREVALGKELEIFGEQFWRPYCHVEDLARGCIHVLESEPSIVGYNVFGVGDTRENYQKAMIAEELLKVAPNATIRYIARSEDPRDYRVDFSKIKNELGFEITRTVPDGIREIFRILKDGIISDPYSKAYQNI
jgi:nucleoside-diphosphate-sugar epimerase